MILESLKPTGFLTPTCDLSVGVIGSERSIALPRVTQLSNGRVMLQFLCLRDSTSSVLSRTYYIRCEEQGREQAVRELTFLQTLHVPLPTDSGSQRAHTRATLGATITTQLCSELVALAGAAKLGFTSSGFSDSHSQQCYGCPVSANPSSPPPFL